MNLKFCPNCGKPTIIKHSETHYKCSSCHESFWNNAKATVAVVFAKDNQMLVSERAIEPKKGMYDLPGGFVEFGENPYDTAIREIKEETSVDIKREHIELIEVYTNQYLPNIFTVDIVFLIHKWTGTFKPSDDTASLSWHPFSFICDEHFSPPYNGLDKLLLSRFGK